MRKALLFFISLIQTIIGIVIIYQINSFFSGGDINLGLTIFLLVVSFLLAVLVVFVIRKYEVWLPLIVEVLLTPLSFFRYLIGGILALTLRKDFALESRAHELLNSVAEYTIYVEITDTMALSKGGNFLSMLLFAFPVSFIMSYSFWNDIFLCDWVFNNFGISLPRYNIIIGIILIMFFSGALCVIRNQAAEYEYYNPHYKFENIYSGKKERTFSENRLYINDLGYKKGWRKVSGGDETHITVEMGLTLLFSPFLVFTYFIGLIAAFLSIFIFPIHSCIGQIYYKDVPLGSVQRILHFFCAFVIVPELQENKKIIKNRDRVFKKHKNENKVETKTYSSKNYYKSKYVKKKMSFGEVIVWPFKKIWEGIVWLFEFFKDRCDSAWDVISCILMVIFFPIVLIFIGIRALVKYIVNNCDSLLGFFVIIGKILISPFLLIGKLLSLLKGNGSSDTVKGGILISFLVVVLAGVYLLMGRTGFISKLTFEIDFSFITAFFSKFYLTGLIAGLFEGAGLLCILLAILIAIVAVIEFVLMIIGFILMLVLTILCGLLQLTYIVLIPVGLVLFSLIIYFKNFSESGIVGNILSLLFIIACGVAVAFYGIDLYSMMFPG